MSRWNNIPKQRYLPKYWVVGDCWRCCIAAILGVRAEEVPHFLDKYGIRRFIGETRAWLTAQGFVLCHHGTMPATNGPLIAAGPKVGGKRATLHAVVWENGGVVYNPCPDDTAISAVSDWWTIASKA